MANNTKKTKKNKGGRPHLPAILRQIQEIEREELTKTFSMKLYLTKVKLEMVVKDPKSMAKDVGIAKAILIWMESGDFRYIRDYIEYIFGKPKQIVEGSGMGGDTHYHFTTIKEALERAANIVNDRRRIPAGIDDPEGEGKLES